MKKQKQKAVPIGRLLPELVIWSFNDDEEIVRHYADQLARAIQLSYNLSNFGLQSFGMSEEE
jgi:hypothetical protein